MKILAIGDSFTYGSELPDASVVAGTGANLIYEHPSELAWPSLLAKQLNGTVNNLGLPGGSNSRIFRLAVSELVKEEYDLIICAWTHLARIDIMHNGKEFPCTINTPQWVTRDVPWISDYYKISYDEMHAAETWLTQLITLQDFFKYRNQRYIFLNIEGAGIFPGFLGIKNINRVIPRFRGLVSQIDKKYYMGWPEAGMVDWMGDCAKGPGGHPLELGHERIADKINEHIRNIGWLP